MVEISELKKEEIDKRELIEKIRWFATARYLGVVLLIILGVPVALSIGAFGELYSSLLLALAVLLYNSFGLAYTKLREISGSFKELGIIAFLLILADTLVFTSLIHLSGGIVSPFVFLYLYSIVVCGVFFVRFPWVVLLLAGVITIFYDGMLYLTHLKIISLPEVFPGIFAMHQSVAAVIIFGIVIPAAIWFLSFFVTQSNKIMSRLGEIERKEKKALQDSKIEVEKRVKQLEEARRTTQHALKDMDKARKATLNIMEDLQDSKIDLEDKVKKLEEARRATIHMLKDIETNRKEITNLYEKLKVIDRMKTEFLSMVSHELRTPLTPIRGYISLFLNEKFGKLAPEYKKGMSVIKKESEHLQAIIESILDVSRLEFGKALVLQKDPLSIKVILDELVEAMQPQLESRQIKMEVDLPEDFPTLMADQTKVRRLLTNLLGNALKFTPQKGWIKIVGLKRDDSVEIQVIDSGIGIAKENLEKVFEKFYQLDSSYTRAAGGIGLGLSIAGEIVNAHGGKIWAESEGLGKGARFCFILPIGGGE